MAFLTKLFNRSNTKNVKEFESFMAKINSFEEGLKKLSDEGLKGKTEEFKRKIQDSGFKNQEETKNMDSNSRIEVRDKLRGNDNAIDKVLQVIFPYTSSPAVRTAHYAPAVNLISFFI